MSGISDQLLLCFKDYLYNCKQFVVLSGVYSDTVSISIGVPQGSNSFSSIFTTLSWIYPPIGIFADEKLFMSL